MAAIMKDYFGQAWQYAEQIDVIFDAFSNAIEDNYKTRNLRDTVIEINEDPGEWARRFAMKCQIELEEMCRAAR